VSESVHGTPAIARRERRFWYSSDLESIEMLSSLFPVFRGKLPGISGKKRISPKYRETQFAVDSDSCFGHLHAGLECARAVARGWPVGIFLRVFTRWLKWVGQTERAVCRAKSDAEAGRTLPRAPRALGLRCTEQTAM
jgi:hypothetical protein